MSSAVRSGKSARICFFAHPAGEVLQHVRDGHSGFANSRFAAAFARFDGDDLAIIHEAMITKRIDLARQSKQLGSDGKDGS